MKRVLVPMADGLEEIETVAIIDVLRRGGVEVVMAHVGENPEVVGAHNIRIVAEKPLHEVIDADYAAIILPGGGKGTENLANCEPLLDRLVRQRDEGRLVCAICAAPTVLAKAGVIAEDDKVTCYPSCARDMYHPVEDVPAIADGNVITGQGPGAAILFSLVTLAHVVNEDRAERIASDMVYQFG